MTLYQLPDGQSQASRGTMTCFTSDYDLVHGRPPLTNFTDEHDPLTGLHDSLCKCQEIKTCTLGWRWGWSTSMDGLASRGWPKRISQNEPRRPHRWATTHLTGRLSSASKVDYDMTPKWMVNTHLIGDPTYHIITKHWSHTCESGTALLRAHWSQGPFSTSHEVWTRHT